MFADNIDNVIARALMAINMNTKISRKEILNKFSTQICENMDLICSANEVDVKNSNGFKINPQVLNNVLNTSLNLSISYGDVVTSERDLAKKIIYGKQVSNVGNVVVFFDGNTYALIDLIVKNILANNTVIFITNGYMYGTNHAIINIAQEVFKLCGLSEHYFQDFISDNYEGILSKYTSFDLVIALGDKMLQHKVASHSKGRTILSGYGYYDLYIDDATHLDFIQKIFSQGINIDLYTDQKYIVNDYDAISVNDIDEAIGQINLNSARYASVIFTNNSELAAKFLREVKSKQVLVNASPSIESFVDISIENLINMKTIIYPMSYKFIESNEGN